MSKQKIMALVRTFEQSANRKGELWERCQGKGWPDAESDEFTTLRDSKIPELRAAIEAALPDVPTVPELIDIDDLKDRLVAISEAVADQDDRAAQAILGELLRLLSAAPEPAQAERCPYCGGSGDVHGIDGQWRGACTCDSVQEPAQAEQPRNEPVQQEHVGVFREDDDIGHVDLCPHQQMKLKDGDLLYAAPQAQPMSGMSVINRTIAYCAASKLRGLGYEWDGSEWSSPEEKPMSDEQIFELAEPFGWFEYGDSQGHKRLEFARAVERFHKIGG
jgi:hypothetical protein